VDTRYAGALSATDKRSVEGNQGRLRWPAVQMQSVAKTNSAACEAQRRNNSGFILNLDVVKPEQAAERRAYRVLAKRMDAA